MNIDRALKIVGLVWLAVCLVTAGMFLGAWLQREFGHCPTCSDCTERVEAIDEVARLQAKAHAVAIERVTTAALTMPAPRCRR